MNKKDQTKKKVESKKKVVKEQKKSEAQNNGLIAALLFIAAVLSIALVVKIAHPNTVENKVVMYNSYDDNLIQVKNETSIKVQANLFSSKRNLGVLLESTEEKNALVNLTYKVIDENNNEISSEETTVVLLGEAKNGYCFTLPELDNEILRSIIIEITSEEFQEGKAYNVKAFTNQVEQNIDETKNMELVTTWRYNGTQQISQVTGLTVAMKDEKIVDMGFFRADLENQEFTSTIIFGNQFKNNQLVALEYDSLETFVTYYQ